jgi:hypothetical protein
MGIKETLDEISRAHAYLGMKLGILITEHINNLPPYSSWQNPKFLEYLREIADGTTSAEPGRGEAQNLFPESEDIPTIQRMMSVSQAELQKIAAMILEAMNRAIGQ